MCRKSGAVYMVFEAGEIDLHKLLQKNGAAAAERPAAARLNPACVTRA